VGKYEEMLEKIAKMNPDEENTLLERNRNLCNCPRCPSYTPCMQEKKERMFCWAGKSSCAVNQSGCLCPTCPVTAFMGYSYTYFCINGPERDLREK
jgi:hypothetical protein